MFVIDCKITLNSVHFKLNHIKLIKIVFKCTLFFTEGRHIKRRIFSIPELKQDRRSAVAVNYLGHI